jgi:predicted nucleotidyltransferase
MSAENKVPHAELSEFVSRLQKAAGANLVSVILYGSAATNEFDPEFSDVNLMCVLRETSFSALEALLPAVAWWNGKKRRPPLLMSREELERSADVFSIEMIDMQKRHRVLSGEDVLAALKIPMHLHRAQVEYELREKLILLRQRLLVAMNDPKQMWELLLSSLPTFATLFRHVLIAQGKEVPSTKREVVKTVAAHSRIDAAAFEQLLDIREHRAHPKQFNVKDLAGRYLALVEQVTAAVDRLLDSPAPPKDE